jgi:hypothetical protein
MVVEFKREGRVQMIFQGILRFRTTIPRKSQAGQ